MIERYNHVSITVANLDKSLDFYAGLLGLRVRGRGAARGGHLDKIIGLGEVDLLWAELEVGEQILELFEYLQPSGVEARSRTCDSGNVHVALEVTDIDESFRRLKAAGVVCQSPPVTIPRGDWRDTRCMYVVDPDGVTIELLELPNRR